MSNLNIRTTRDNDAFDHRSGSLIERGIFNHRALFLLLCLLITAFFIMQAKNLGVSASYDKMLPKAHPYIQNFMEYRDGLRGLGDNIRVVVKVKEGTIYQKDYLKTLAAINDEIFILHGVDRPWMRSLVTPVVRWTEATEEGFRGGPVLPNGYDGSARSIAQLEQNVMRAGLVGSLVSNDATSSMIVIPLVSQDADGEPIDYHALATQIEDIRTRYEADPEHPVSIHVIGFAKLIGDLIDGLYQVMVFFVAALIITLVILFAYTHCIRSSILVIACSLVGVSWQLGMIAVLGLDLDPFSMLVPFLVVAVGVSHGAQKMNGIMQDIGRGASPYVAARLTFRRLFLAGLTALAADVAGFAVLMVIDIEVIRELALTASIGVGVLIITNLIMIPILMSYIGVSPRAAKRSLAAEQKRTGEAHGFTHVWRFLEKFTTRRWASAAVIATVALAAWGLTTSRDLQIGDLDAGAPELRPDSRYNLDNAFITTNYGISSDIFAVMVVTAYDGCRDYQTMTEIDRLAWHLEQVPGVQQTSSLAHTIRNYTSGMFEGNPKWGTISDNQGLIDSQVNNAVAWNSEFLNTHCDLTPVVAFLSDHKAETLQRVVDAASSFAEQANNDQHQFLLAAGNSGVDAATNAVVDSSNRKMLLYVYLVVAALCLVIFRSFLALIVALVPLMLTSILTEALMVLLGIGVKVSTLPVVALGVGIGIDYAIYLLSSQLAFQRMGYGVSEAYSRALAATGKVVGLVGVTLAAGVITWIWSPIKFQADMGILLTFMFACNMLGALILVPALSHFLLPRLTKQDTIGRPGS
ncbi:MMPL family transporter [Halopseudomonas sp. SMJS2]|uniref:efflux RND transporter permease subunit n=1 Tax=Halopseudomonas sp. SMJS2 TaxID=3041098 RepID=UPI002452DE50|nr:MMPL family transporter [Halopseudomonas sp. SMJS2]WGK62461.1 MMPL family transporter [Halopseudomonas sp. SMJS2]